MITQPITRTVAPRKMMVVSTDNYYFGLLHLQKLVEQHCPGQPVYVDNFIAGSLQFLKSLVERYGYLAINDFYESDFTAPITAKLYEWANEGIPVFIGLRKGAEMPQIWKPIAERITLEQNANAA